MKYSEAGNAHSRLSLFTADEDGGDEHSSPGTGSEEGLCAAAMARQAAAIRRRREERVDVLGYRNHLDALYRISTVASAEPDISRFLAQMLDISLAVLGGDSGCVMLTTRGRNDERQLSIAASKGLQLRAETPVPFGDDVAGWSAQQNRPLRLVGSLGNYPQFKGLESNPGIAESLVVPISRQAAARTLLRKLHRVWARRRLT